MAGCLRHDLIGPADVENVAVGQERSGLLLDYCIEGRIDFVRIACLQDRQVYAKSARRLLRLSHVSLGYTGIAWVHE